MTALALFALGVRMANLDVIHAPDDYLHMLAAQSLLHEGTLATDGGEPYTRGLLFTFLVAGFMSLAGETTYVARLPAVLAGTALVAVLFAWMRLHAGRAAAWIGGLLLAVDPGAIAVSQLVRFYTPQSLAFMGGAIGVYALITGSRSYGRSFWPLLATIALLSLSLHLQVTTVVGLMALASWALLDVGPRAITSARDDPPKPLTWTLACVAVIAVGGLVFVSSGLAAELWGRFRNVPLWAAYRQDDIGYYLRRLYSGYPLLVAFFPVAAVLAMARFGRPALFCVVLFTVPLVIHSGAAFKAERYLSYAVPFLFATWGMAVASILPALRDAAEAAVIQVMPGRAHGRIARGAGWAVCFLLFLGLARTTPAFSKAYHLALPGGLPEHVRTGPDWRGAAKELQAELASADVVISSGRSAAYFQLGRLDVILNYAQADRDSGEFGMHNFLNRPVITKPESLELLMKCHGSGLVTIEKSFWTRPLAEPDRLRDFLEDRLESLPLPAAFRIQAFRWARAAQHEGHPEQPSECGPYAAPGERRASLRALRHANGDTSCKLRLMREPRESG